MSDNPLARRMREIVASAREATSSDGPDNPVDRTLAALTLLAAAGMLAWPRGRKTPEIVGRVAVLAKHVWARRDWWLPATHPGLED